MGDCTKLICFLLQNDAAVDCCDQNKRTPLSWAVEYGALNTMKILLENSAEINSTNDMFCMPLTWLLYVGDLSRGQNTDTEAYLREMGAKEKGAKQ